MQDIIIRISVDVLPISLFDTTWTLLFSSMLLHLSPSPSTSNNIITVHNKLFGCGFIANHHCCFKIMTEGRQTNKFGCWPQIQIQWTVQDIYTGHGD